MDFRAEEYYRASTERMRQARAIFNSGQGYALAMYCGGLAVECMLRAYRWRRDRSFTGRHDLTDLLRASDLIGIDEAHMRRRGVPTEEAVAYALELQAALNEIVILWHNNLRFASEARLRAHLNKLGRLRGVKGDALKKNAADLLNAAQTVIDRGVTLWNSARK
jgi:hypothetical protein